MLTDEGSIWVWGDGAAGQLGNGMGWEDEKVKEEKEKEANAAADEGGDTERSSHDRPPEEDDEFRISRPGPSFPAFAGQYSRLLKGQIAVDVACGTSITVAVTSQGQLFQWGCAEDSVRSTPTDAVAHGLLSCTRSA
jgi:alpha-tubulin suppressor-like RCC1 family protein